MKTMTTMENTYYLIVTQSAQPPEGFQNLLQLLAQRFKLDLYQCRQRLLGKGFSLLAKGSQSDLEKISQPLSEYAISHWVITPTKPAFAPQRIKAITARTDALSFTCAKETIVFPAACKVLAIFADLSGELATKSVKHLLTSHAYRGRDHIEHIQDEKIFQTIMQGMPVLDLFLLNENYSIVTGVRVFPGKFDPQGLGERATLSSRQNLKAILDIITNDYASELILHTDFGLANLPGCRLNQSNPKDPETMRHNLTSLTRYGWLMADIARADHNKKDAQEEPVEQLVTSAPLLVASGMLATEPLSTEVQNTIMSEIHGEQDQSESKSTQDNSSPGLPAPPSGESGQRWNTPAFWLGSGGGLIMALVIGALQLDHSHTLRAILSRLLASGILPLAFALLMFWYAFYFLRLKRQIENTPTSRVRSVAMGMVEVKGQAVRKYALVSPMTHSACAYYKLTRYRRGKNNNWEVSSVASSHHVSFYLEDDTGRIEIDPSNCRVKAGSRQEGMPGQVGLFHVDSDSNEKWVEEVVVEGTLLYVLGYATIKKSPEPTLNERKQKALRELKQNPHKLKRYDTDGDGHISSDEWDSARDDVENQLFQESLATNRRKKQEEHIVISKRNGRPLIISETHSEDHLTARYQIYSLLLFVLAGATTGLAIYFLLHNLS